MTEAQTVEIKSDLWQKIFISLLWLTVGVYGGGGCMLLAIFPRWMSDGDKATLLERASIFLGGSLFFGSFFYLWWLVFSYYLRADTDGITYRHGFRTKQVRWQDVASYQMEANTNWHKERRLHVEPVLKDAHGHVIFRAPAHILVSSRSILHERGAFWQFVEEQLKDKPEMADASVKCKLTH